MIVPDISQNAVAVADHYDELDPIYRRVWGEHVHHGLWVTGHETPGEAVEALVETVGDRLGLMPGQACLDIGCGYGSTARWLAVTRGVRVTGFTLSAEQARYAAAHPIPDVDIQVRDWLANGLDDASADAAWAIESSEHMVDKPRFFAEAHRVLSPGGRFVICAWLAETDASGWKVRHLLEPICREGRLPSMGTREEYEAMARAAGFTVTGYEDVSSRVARTWPICAGRLVKLLLTDGETRRLALGSRNRNSFLGIPRLILAYRTGAMRYGIFTLAKAAESGP
ncbi:class I SAM-dependent methyltransferase [Arthrobacter sp. NicSoilB11]|uniref:class I SAM-dependent methyltransferase n=1 Tax=Arthrobacter sp. NicSoilB11 TaxID=2830999 RepID=UPI001CC52238|nr:class I SAM-dependent methyltransferase [Arthrobacter sp. NicSoilB11]BCW74777.1 delta(24)-sterol C-methyltransferase [Arthrobacter sp. NicSoilB11]